MDNAEYLRKYTPQMWELALKRVGKPLKNPHPDVMCINVKLYDSRTIGFIREEVAQVKKYFVNTDDIFILNYDGIRVFNKLEIGIPSSPWDEYTEFSAQTRLYKCPEKPADFILNYPITFLLSVMTIPTEEGKAKLWVHKNSYTARKANGGLDIDYKDGINPHAASQWTYDHIVEYIKASKYLSRPIERQSMCNILKNVVTNERIRAESKEEEGDDSW